MATKPRVELTILVHTTYRLTVEVDEIPTDHDALQGMVEFCTTPKELLRPPGLRDGVSAEYHYRLDDVEVNGKPIIF